jgi:hypothetical protein
MVGAASNDCVGFAPSNGDVVCRIAAVCPILKGSSIWAWLTSTAQHPVLDDGAAGWARQPHRAA